MPTPHDHLIANLADAIAGEDEHATDRAIFALEAAVGVDAAAPIIDELLEAECRRLLSPVPPPRTLVRGLVKVKCA